MMDIDRLREAVEAWLHRKAGSWPQPPEEAAKSVRRGPHQNQSDQLLAEAYLAIFHNPHAD